MRNEKLIMHGFFLSELTLSKLYSGKWRPSDKKITTIPALAKTKYR